KEGNTHQRVLRLLEVQDMELATRFKDPVNFFKGFQLLLHSQVMDEQAGEDMMKPITRKRDLIRKAFHKVDRIGAVFLHLLFRDGKDFRIGIESHYVHAGMGLLKQQGERSSTTRQVHYQLAWLKGRMV